MGLLLFVCVLTTTVYGFAGRVSEVVSVVTRLLVSCGAVTTTVVSHWRIQARHVFVHVDH